MPPSTRSTRRDCSGSVEVTVCQELRSRLRSSIPRLAVRELRSRNAGTEARVHTGWGSAAFWDLVGRFGSQGLGAGEDEFFRLEFADPVAELGGLFEFELLRGFAHVGFEAGDVFVKLFL